MDVGNKNTGQHVFCILYVGECRCDLEHRVRFIVRCPLDDVNLITVYNVHRAFTVMKDVLPTNLLYKVSCIFF